MLLLAALSAALSVVADSNAAVRVVQQATQNAGAGPDAWPDAPPPRPYQPLSLGQKCSVGDAGACPRNQEKCANGRAEYCKPDARLICTAAAVNAAAASADAPMQIGDFGAMMALASGQRSGEVPLTRDVLPLIAQHLREGVCLAKPGMPCSQQLYWRSPTAETKSHCAEGRVCSVGLAWVDESTPRAAESTLWPDGGRTQDGNMTLIDRRWLVKRCLLPDKAQCYPPKTVGGGKYTEYRHPVEKWNGYDPLPDPGPGRPFSAASIPSHVPADRAGYCKSGVCAESESESFCQESLSEGEYLLAQEPGPTAS